MKRQNLFHDASIRLTAIYLSIFMAISISMSIGSYVSYAREIDRDIRRPLPKFIERFSTTELQEIILDRQEGLQKSKDDYRTVLIGINAILLIGGGLASYYLARRSLRPIEQAHEAQSRFTADASHELRTPITAMRLENEVSLSDPKLTLSQAKKQLQSNIEELDKLTNLSENLLQLAQLDNDELAAKQTSIYDIITAAIAQIEKQATQKKLEIIYENKNDTTLHANVSGITTALGILLDNAVKYSPENSKIIITKTVRSKTLSVSIKDTGSGIKASELPHIFDRFYRADSSRTNSSEHGYGIGLSIAQSIITRHGGKITAKSTPKKGSTFTVSLPLS